MNWLRKWFVPHAENGHYPRFWRSGPLAAVVALVLLAGAARFAVPLMFRAGSPLAAILPSVVVALTNGEREDLGESALSESALLQAAAQMKAEDMASRGYFAHVTPEGWTPWHWLDEVGYGYASAGENLAVNFDDSEDVVRAWMKSPTHRANIVKGKYTEIGVGMAKGEYKGRRAIYVVQFFGKPKADGATGIAAAPAATPASAVGAFEFAETVADIVASPRSAGAYVLWGLLGLVALAFVVAVFVAIRIQFRLILWGGAALILVIAALLWQDSRAEDAERLLGGQSATSTDQAN